jgi:DNA polymerase III epsilon subunit-like protein
VNTSSDSQIQLSLSAEDATAGQPFVSVDVETAGPNPGQYPLLSIGACLVWNPERTFYVELQPTGREAVPSALEVSGLDLDQLATTGVAPTEAMRQFDRWLALQFPAGVTPIFVAFNAPFDWMFINDYFHRFLGRNPFGHTALDIKAYYMGLTGVAWSETSMRAISMNHSSRTPLSHHALQDALDQAELFRTLLAKASQSKSGPQKEDR